MYSEIFNRAELLLGPEAMKRVRHSRVLVLGVGGVGSWCAECLVRNGIEHLTLVDADVVCVTNCNRQLMATSLTIGRPKVEAMRERLLEINPEADIRALEMQYCAETRDSFSWDDFDYVVDAIDSLRDKVDLIMHVTSLPHLTLFSSMGAALRLDPTRIRVAEFWKVQGDPLASAMRSTMRRNKLFPARKFRCVYSEEPPMTNVGQPAEDGSQTYHKVRTNGSLAHITAIFGMTLAGLVLQDILDSINRMTS